MQRIQIIVMVMATMMANAAFSAEETLQNDGFTSGAAVTFQAGFVVGEMAASRFEPQIACPCIVEKITLVFGGASGAQSVGINVWEDSAGADAPGALVFSGDVTLTGSNVNLQEIDLSLTPIIVNGPFRVGLEFGHNGLPSVATDSDGTINAAANFILADLGGFFFWFQSATLGVTGDFVIRATIDNLLSADLDEDGIPDEADNCVEEPNADQRDTNLDGFGNLCDADLNNDCVINFADIAAMGAVFFQPGDLDADLNGDGVVNFIDFADMTANFLGQPGPSGVPTNCDPVSPN